MAHLVNWRKAAKEFGYLGGENGTDTFKLIPKQGTSDYDKIKVRFAELEEERKSKPVKKTTKKATKKS